MLVRISARRGQLAAAMVVCAALSPAMAFSPSGFLGSPSRQHLSSARTGRSRPSVVAAPRMGLFDGIFGGQDKAEEEDPLLSRNYRPAARQDGSWQEYADDNGNKYFYNTATQETLWEAEFIERTRQLQAKAMQKQAVGAGVGQGAVQQVQQNQGFVPAWMRNAQAASSGTNTVWKQGDEMDPQKFKVMWRANGGTKMQQGGFGYVYFGGYDATPNPKARPLSINTAIKLPNTDPDSVKAHYLEMEINKKIAADGGVPGVADFIGTVDLSPIKAQLPPGIGAMDGIVWRTVEGRTLDNFFDRGGGMSPVLANVLKVTDSKPTKIKGGVCYIKTELCRNVLGRTLIPLSALHEKGIIHRDLKPRNIMLAEKDPQNPLCIIDFGSAITKGSRPFMNDFTAVYAPPEAPEPDFFKPESYDIFHLGITALRVLMPSLIAGENGIATLGKVATVEIPGYDYDLRAWATARATDTASRFEFKALNAECEALLNQPELMDLLCKMLDKNPANRPSAEQCIQMLGPEWVARLGEYKEGRQSRGNCGTCGQPVYSSDKGRFRDARGTYFHEGCAQMYT